MPHKLSCWCAHVCVCVCIQSGRMGVQVNNVLFQMREGGRWEIEVGARGIIVLSVSPITH